MKGKNRWEDRMKKYLRNHPDKIERGIKCLNGGGADVPAPEELKRDDRFEEAKHLGVDLYTQGNAHLDLLLMTSSRQLIIGELKWGPSAGDDALLQILDYACWLELAMKTASSQHGTINAIQKSGYDPSKPIGLYIIVGVYASKRLINRVHYLRDDLASRLKIFVFAPEDCDPCLWRGDDLGGWKCREVSIQR